MILYIWILIFSFWLKLKRWSTNCFQSFEMNKLIRRNVMNGIGDFDAFLSQIVICHLSTCEWISNKSVEKYMRHGALPCAIAIPNA